MDLRETLSSLLPAPRDDEPTSLRQDIIDELGDHLACAYKRELLRGTDAKIARQRVLDRFGNPAAVARRLWLDAMKGKIMAQRVLITSCLAVALACISLVGLVYVQSSRAAAQAAEANRKLTEALAQAQSTNKDMLSKLGEMSEAIKNPRSLDWNPVRITITEDTPDGPPVAGCSITLYLRDPPQRQISRTSDASGIADFGLVNPGEYSITVSRRLDRRTLSGAGQLIVDPGSRINQRILLPKKALAPVPLQVRCEWPADLGKEGLILDASFRFVGIQNNGVVWGFNYGMGTPTTHSVILGPGAAVNEILNPAGLYTWAISNQNPLAAVLTSDLRAVNDQTASLKWQQGIYQLSELIVLRPYKSIAGAPGRQQFDVVVCCYPPHTALGTFHSLQQPPTDEELRAEGTEITGQMPTHGLVLPKESWSKINTIFAARPDHSNEWMITLPEELIETVREGLKADPSGEEKPPVSAVAPYAR
jgi:hypothetical protein